MKELPATGLHSAEVVRRQWRIVVAAETSREDLARPAFWAHVAAKLRAGDLIEVLAEDNSFYAELIVRFARRLEASVSMLRFEKLDSVIKAEDLRGEYQTAYRGHKNKWCVLRGQNTLKAGFETETQALAWLSDHTQQLAA